jgi:hypothetical protein
MQYKQYIQYRLGTGGVSCRALVCGQHNTRGLDTLKAVKIETGGTKRWSLATLRAC